MFNKRHNFERRNKMICQITSGSQFGNDTYTGFGCTGVWGCGFQWKSETFSNSIV